MCKLWFTEFKNSFACEDCPLFETPEVTNCDRWSEPWEVEAIIHKLQKVKELLEKPIDNN